jgi:hypothetical protein
MRIRLVFAVAVVVAVTAAGCSSDSSEPDDVINEFVAAYNSGDIDAVMEVFSEESEINGHPAVGFMTGLSQIRVIHETEDMIYAAEENAYTISNVEVTGDTVTWDHVWVSDIGETFCVDGHTAVVKDGKILTWTWPGTFGC